MNGSTTRLRYTHLCTHCKHADILTIILHAQRVLPEFLEIWARLCKPESPIVILPSMPEQTDVFFRDIMALATSPEGLRKQLCEGEVLILDYRPNSTYTRSHIEGALNLSVPGILLRRLKRGKVTFRSFIHGDEAKERFTRKSHSVPVVLYDENSSEVNANSDSPFVLLLKKLKEEGCHATYLQGRPSNSTMFMTADYKRLSVHVFNNML